MAPPGRVELPACGFGGRRSCSAELWRRKVLAVREGFEPPEPTRRFNCFRGSRIQPLCHLTKGTLKHSARCAAQVLAFFCRML